MNTYSKYSFLLKENIFAVCSLQMVTFEPYIHGSGRNFALADIHRNLLSTREAAWFVNKQLGFLKVFITLLKNVAFYE